MIEVQIAGTGNYVPDMCISNDDLSKIVETSDEWIRSRTGIGSRRISTGENTSELSTKAALEAMKNAGITAEEIDLIIVATVTPDCFTPSTACIVQGNIGAVNAVCFDISSACSGFIYGMNIATQFIKTGQCKNALVIGAETLSKILNWSDRNTCVLFGDGAGAAVLKASSEKGILAFHTGSDGRKAELLKCETLPIKNPFASVESNLFNGTLTMDGKEIFKFAVKVMLETIENLLNTTGLSMKDIKYIVPHQANYRIIDYTAKKLKIDENKFYVNLDRYGNTSAASIPIAFHEMVSQGVVEKGDKLLLVGFGGGLTWGGTIIQM